MIIVCKSIEVFSFLKSCMVLPVVNPGIPVVEPCEDGFMSIIVGRLEEDGHRTVVRVEEDPVTACECLKVNMKTP